MGFFIVSAFVLVIVAAIVSSVKIIPVEERWVAQRFGRNHRELSAGLNVLVPFIEQAKRVRDAGEIPGTPKKPRRIL